jgi:hypothetical protein
VFVSGNGRTATFSILVPISYLLLFAPVLLLPCRWHRYCLAVACALVFLGIYLLGRYGLRSGNLGLFAIGYLGMVLGTIPTQRLNRVASQPGLVLLAYAAYLIAITVWSETYPLQVVGVCLSVLLLYAVGRRLTGQSWVQQRILVLGKSSLLTYIAQIALLLFLSALLRVSDLGTFTIPISCAMAFGMTSAVVEAVGWARTKSCAFDRTYKAVFA